MKTIPLFDDFSLRSLCSGDAPAIFGAIDTQREHLGRWLPFVAATHRVEQTQEVVAGMLNDTANPVFTIRSGDAFAGLIGFKSADGTTRTIEIGYWLRSEFQGRGIMTSAVQALCRLAFEEMGMERIEIRCAPGNLRSNRIPQRLGFRLDRVEVRGEQLSDGEFVDLNIYLCWSAEKEAEKPTASPFPQSDNKPKLPAYTLRLRTVRDKSPTTPPLWMRSAARASPAGNSCRTG